jgi:hypothetical protein
MVNHLRKYDGESYGYMTRHKEKYFSYMVDAFTAGGAPIRGSELEASK